LRREMLEACYRDVAECAAIAGGILREARSRYKLGVISNFYGNKVEIMYFTTADHTQGSGDIIDLPAYGQQVDYSIELSKK